MILNTAEKEKGKKKEDRDSYNKVHLINKLIPKMYKKFRLHTYLSNQNLIYKQVL